MEQFDFSNVRHRADERGGDVTGWSERIARRPVVIDNSSAFRMDPDVAPDRAGGERRRRRGLPRQNIIANPNCSPAQLVVALKPLHDVAGIKPRGGLDLSGPSQAPVSRPWTSCGPDQGDVRARVSRPRSIQADRLQRHPPREDFREGTPTRKQDGDETAKILDAIG
jgi:hypothetical protein